MKQNKNITFIIKILPILGLIYFLDSCSTNQETIDREISFTEIFRNRSLEYIENFENSADSTIYQDSYRPFQNLLIFIQEGVEKELFTAAQLAQLVEKFNPNNKVVRKVLKAGSKDYWIAIKIEWVLIYNSYVINPSDFIKKHACTGQVFNLNDVFKDWCKKHQDEPLSRSYLVNVETIKLDKLALDFDSLNHIRNNQFDELKIKFKKELISKIKYKKPSFYKRVSNERIDKAVDFVIYKFALDGQGRPSIFNKISPGVDREISRILGM
jgi:hypothetical protein